MGIEHRMVHFRSGDLAEIVAEIDAIAGSGTDRSWVTISPWVDDEHLPVVSVLRRWFSARASKVPEITWVPSLEGQPAQFGVLHGSGPNALERLDESGVEIPAGWSATQDHSKRGLLFSLDPSVTARDIVNVAVVVGGALAEVPTDDRWVAQISTRT